MKNSSGSQDTRVRNGREEQTRDYAPMPVAQIQYGHDQWDADVEVDGDELARIRAVEAVDPDDQDVQHPLWCDPSSCHADPQHPTDVSHASTTTSTGRSWDRTTGEWKAEAQLNLLEWGDDEPRQVYVVVRFNDEEDVNLYEHDLTQLIGFLETTRTRLFQAAGKDGGEAR